MRDARRRIGLLLTTVIAVSVAGRSFGAENGFTEVFNAKDLSGWVVDGKDAYEKDGKKQAIWQVEDGILLCQGHGFSFLRYEKVLNDFIVRLEFRMTPKCNSGLGIRASKFTGPKSTRPSSTGYEIQILDDHGQRPSRYSSGSLYRYLSPKTNAINPAREWNTVEIECRGPKMKVTLNGRVIHDIDQSQIDALKNKPLSGYFSLQNHNSRIVFRNIRLKETVSRERLKSIQSTPTE